MWSHQTIPSNVESKALEKKVVDKIKERKAKERKKKKSRWDIEHTFTLAKIIA
jgi:hypothetical protein